MWPAELRAAPHAPHPGWSPGCSEPLPAARALPPGVPSARAAWDRLGARRRVWWLRLASVSVPSQACARGRRFVAPGGGRGGGAGRTARGGRSWALPSPAPSRPAPPSPSARPALPLPLHLWLFRPLTPPFLFILFECVLGLGSAPLPGGLMVSRVQALSAVSRLLSRLDPPPCRPLKAQHVTQLSSSGSDRPQASCAPGRRAVWGRPRGAHRPPQLRPGPVTRRSLS